MSLHKPAALSLLKPTVVFTLHRCFHLRPLIGPLLPLRSCHGKHDKDHHGELKIAFINNITRRTKFGFDYTECKIFPGHNLDLEVDVKAISSRKLIITIILIDMNVASALCGHVRTALVSHFPHYPANCAASVVTGQLLNVSLCLVALFA